MCTGRLTPANNCRTAGFGSLTIKNNSDDAKDSVQFKWSKGQSTSLAEFGAPSFNAGCALCVYDNGILAMTADVPAAATCDGKFCWKTLLHQYKFKAKSAFHDGIRAITLTESSVGKSKIALRTAGSALPVMPLSNFVMVQLVKNTGDICFSTVFPSADIKTNTVDKFSARVSLP